ncbi:PASTA domain, binds beta-lactams [Bryocella elongata]|uniref:PASTA domain, binds beta-lactams n=1 Tax=Bryocella elongata TaxID=863522 RepID=A0A1H5ZCI9_9BACT|nr:PASTA domain-containing protein [Bryocella elongata]SEG33794.1 PASTA domain, binds beta-lactams [Bryocella elongata]
MKRKIQFVFTVLCMLVVMLVSAALTLRVALHGHEVTVPDLAGETIPEASTSALRSGVDLYIQNKYYSTTVPAGRVLSQAPASGSRVRHGWQVRVTVSLGPQEVTIPNVVGLPVREASMAVRRDQLDLGTLAHLDAPGDPEMVLAQTPPPNAGVDQPRVSLLLSSNAANASSAFVMPSFAGMGFPAANRAAIALGLRVAAIGEMPQPQPTPQVAGTPGPGGTLLDANGQAIPKPAPIYPAGPVTAQLPESGHRASRGDVVKLYFGNYRPGGGSSASATSGAPGGNSSQGPSH